MANEMAKQPAFVVNRGKVNAGGVLMGVGVALFAAGGAIAGSALLGAARRWMAELDVPPSVVVRQQLAHARAATTAGAEAWRQYSMS